MALGLVGMVYGVASVFGASAGSLILDIAGQENWQWIFYINVPIAIVVVGLGIWALPKETQDSSRRLDLPGILVLVVMTTSILWAFQNLDFTQIGDSLKDRNVWVALVVFLILLPLFWVIEHRVADPIINFKYFGNINVGSTLLMGAVAGILMMTVMFIPQFAENCLRLPSGAGGYPTIIIGVGSAIGSPISGRLTDRFGPRRILGVGTAISTIAGIMLIFWASPHPGIISTSLSIFVMGLGLGFLMGAPLTYLILHLIPGSDANSGQATLSLIRSLGTTLAPAILVGLLATVMGGLSGKVMEAMPEMPPMPTMAAMGNSKSGMPQMKADMGFKMSDLPAPIQEKIKSADVTNVVDRTKEIANYLFDQQEAKIKAQMGTVPPAVEQMRAKYLQDIESHRDQIETAFQMGLNEGFSRLFWFYTILSLAGILLLAGLPSKRKIDAVINPDPSR